MAAASVAAALVVGTVSVPYASADDHLKDKHQVSEISRTDAGADPFYANLSDRVASQVIDGTYDRAILVCGTGIGVCIAANKVPGIRAALTHDTYSAERAALSTPRIFRLNATLSSTDRCGNSA